MTTAAPGRRWPKRRQPGPPTRQPRWGGVAAHSKALSPVLNENGKLLGMVSMGDIAVETEADNELASALEDISKESSFWGKVFG